jgi:hydrogenase nickel incorporation protein HypB
MGETTVPVGQAVLRSAEAEAERLRATFAGHGLLAVNLVSSPGSGKTTLIEALAGALSGRKRIAVVEGDVETDLDAARIRKLGVPVRQINTKTSCHIPPFMLREAVDTLDLAAVDILIVENVGNLVCPAEIPLGEDVRVVALSVTEGDEKPLKYPMIFRTSGILAVTKTDLLPHVRFDPGRVAAAARSVNPSVEVFRMSAVTGEGMAAFAGRLAALHDRKYGRA